MKIRKSSIWLILASILIVTASAAFMYSDFKGNIVKADGNKGVTNGVESSLSVLSKVKPSNPLELLTTGAAVTGSGTEVTVYNNNLALIKERRELELNSGVNKVEYSDVASLIDPTSVVFEDTKNKDTAVLEQNYEYDLVSSQKLLDTNIWTRKLL